MYQNPLQKPVEMWTAPAIAGDAWIKAVGRMQVEIVALATRRMMAALEFPQVVAQCKSPMDAVAEQVRYWQTAQRQYLQSLERMGTAYADVAADPAHGRHDTAPVDDARSSPIAAATPHVVPKSVDNDAVGRSNLPARPMKLELAKSDVAKSDKSVKSDRSVKSGKSDVVVTELVETESAKSDAGRIDAEAEVVAWLYKKSA